MAKSVLHNQMILPADWLIKSKHVFDYEYQRYMVLGALKKFENKIESNDLSGFYEITFHQLNLNAFISEGRLYSHRFIQYPKNDTKQVLEDFLKPTENIDNQSITSNIIRDTKDLFFQTFDKYFDLMIKSIGNVNLIHSNKMIHKENTIFILINVSGSDIYDLWKLEIDNPDEFGGKIENVDHIRSNGDIVTDFRKYIDKYNKTESNKKKIKDTNTMLAHMKRAEDHKSSVYAIKDTIIFNKLFVGMNYNFNANIFMDLENIIREQKTFPYKLITNV